MKKVFVSISLFIVFILVLWYGDINFNASMDALILWFETLVPSLFCVMVLVKVMFAYGIMDLLAKPLAILFSDLLAISKESFSYVIALAFLGFPAGASFINSEVKERNITQEEGKRLLYVCSFATPGFVILTVGSVLFDNISIGICLYVIQFVSGFLLMIITRKQRINATYRHTCTSGTIVPMIGNAMLESGKALYMMGGYLMLCMSISDVLLQFFPSMLQQALSVITEFSRGSVILSSLYLPLIIRLVLVNMLLSFGGLCVHMQVMCMSDAVELRYRTYMKFRIIQALCTGLLTYLTFSLF